MKHSQYIRSIVRMFLVGFVLWTCGCTTSREIARLEERNYPLEVLTKNHLHYTFDHWKIDEAGAISGEVENHITLSHNTELDRQIMGGETETKVSLTLPADSLERMWLTRTVEVVRNDGSRFTTSEWFSDAHGNLKARVNDTGSVQQYSIPVKDIAGIYATDIDVKTALACVGTAACLVFLYRVVYSIASIHFTFSPFPSYWY